MNLANLFLKVKLGLDDAALVVTKVNFLVQAAEVAAADSSLTGPQKLSAVKTALVADLQSIRPDLAAKIDAAWPEITALITGLVTLYHALGAFGFVLKVAAAI